MPAAATVALGLCNTKVSQLASQSVLMVELKWLLLFHMGVSKNSGTPKWMVDFMENPIKMDDLGVPLFLETPIFWDVPHLSTTQQLAASVCVCVAWVHAMICLAWITFLKHAWINHYHFKCKGSGTWNCHNIDHQILGSSVSRSKRQSTAHGYCLTKRGQEKHHPEKHIVSIVIKTYVQTAMTCHV